MKRYDFDVDLAVNLSELVHTYCGTVPHDIGLKLTDIVARYAIPRPSPEEARKAVAEFANACEYHRLAIRDQNKALMEKGYKKVREAEAALLRLMGVTG